MVTTQRGRGALQNAVRRCRGRSVDGQGGVTALMTDDVPPHERSLTRKLSMVLLFERRSFLKLARGGLKPLGESGRHRLIDPLRRILHPPGRARRSIPARASATSLSLGARDAARANGNVDDVLENRVSFPRGRSRCRFEPGPSARSPGVRSLPYSRPIDAARLPLRAKTC